MRKFIIVLLTIVAVLSYLRFNDSLVKDETIIETQEVVVDDSEYKSLEEELNNVKNKNQESISNYERMNKWNEEIKSYLN